MTYQFKTTPYKHQQEVFDISKDKAAYALLMEQGTGKSKVALDTAGHLFYEEKIDAVVIIAPNGVQTNWMKNEVPKHFGVEPYYTYQWNNSVSNKEKERQKWFLLAVGLNLPILVINIDAIATKRGYAYVENFLRTSRALLIVDESTMIKNPKAKRTKAVISLSQYAPYRRILTGTPVPQGPLDLYTQFQFLDPTILGFKSWCAFRARYAILKQEYGAGGRTYQQLIGYRNIDELSASIKDYSYRALKKDCLDLPDKVYKKVYVELSDNQRRLYDELKKSFITELEGVTMTATLALTRLLRLQQITGGHFANEDTKEVTAIDDTCPRVVALQNVIEELPETSQVIIWAKHTAEIELIVNHLNSVFGNNKAVAYYGKTSTDRRHTIVTAFQLGGIRFFVANKTAAWGLTLTAADTVIYYSNDFSLEVRLQSEDRAHREGQKNKVTYYDIEAVDTLDKKIIQLLRSKKEVADLVTGDIGEWI